MISAYYQLAKPGIIYGNAVTAIGGFLLAAHGHFHLGLFVAMLAGISLVIGSACVFNNYLDRGIDAKMARTKHRALVSGQISGRAALIYATALGLIGLALLAAFTNPLTLGLAVFGLFAYVVLYGVAKRRTVHGTLVGSLSGAVPVVVGYCAVTGRFDTGAVLLFLILVAWQMPHFYAIATYRAADYAAAGLPVLPVKQGIPAAKIQITAYIIAFLMAVSALTAFGYTGYPYLAVMLILGLAWLVLAIRGFRPHTDPNRWGRQVFRLSLIIILVFSVMISLW